VRARIALGLLLAVWLAGGLLLTVLPPILPPTRLVEPNFVPFKTIGVYLVNLDSGYWVGQMIANLLLLLPVGLLGPIVLPWMDRWARVLAVSVALSAAIELAQLWVPDRSADVDDVLLNVAGALMGYAILTLMRAVGMTRHRTVAEGTDERGAAAR
jgi:glycopeptide antibiotics resistance protein